MRGLVAAYGTTYRWMLGQRVLRYGWVALLAASGAWGLAPGTPLMRTLREVRRASLGVEAGVSVDLTRPRRQDHVVPVLLRVP
jgi:hypothetical protein